jgi:hypothetical protein
MSNYIRGGVNRQPGCTREARKENTISQET